MAGVVHITEEEAAKDFAAVMKRVRSGDEVRLDCKDGIQAIVKRADGNQRVKTRSISPITERREAAKGLSVLDDEFFIDVSEAHKAPKVALNQPTFQRRTTAEAIGILRRIEETEGHAVPDPEMASDMEDIHALYNQPTRVSQSRTKGRTAAEILKRLDEWESVHGVLVIDEGFADDVEAAHERLNRPIDSSKWD
jgi:hypothetical protein